MHKIIFYKYINSPPKGGGFHPSQNYKLKKLSKPLKKQKNKGKIENINAGLKAIYAKKGHTELKTLKEWNKAGFRVKKGEHALLLWGSKKTSIPRINEQNIDPYDFFPICFVFSQLQVQEKNSRNDNTNS